MAIATATIVRTKQDIQFPPADNARTVIVRAGRKGAGRELARLELRGNLAQASEVLSHPGLRGWEVRWA